MVEYKTVILNSKITINGTTSMIDKTLNEYAEEGWKLSTISSIDGLGGSFICVFEKDKK